MLYQIMVEIKNGKFLEFHKEETGLLPMEVQLAMDSKGVARGIGVYDDGGRDPVAFDDWVKNEIISVYNVQKSHYDIAKGIFG